MSNLVTFNMALSKGCIVS